MQKRRTRSICFLWVLDYLILTIQIPHGFLSEKIFKEFRYTISIYNCIYQKQLINEHNKSHYTFDGYDFLYFYDIIFMI